MSRWEPDDLAAILTGMESGEIVGPIPELMPRSDGPGLLYPAQIHSLSGEPETGKGWIVQAEAARLLALGYRVLYIDFETTAGEIIERLFSLGVTAAQILEHFTYTRPDAAPDAGTIPALLAGGPFALAIIDGLSEAFTLCGLDPYSNSDAAKFFAAVPRPIADSGAAVALIDHVVKAAESRGRYALGAGHKLAASAVAYTVETLTAPNRLSAGKLKLTIRKDRHGHIRGHADSSGTIALVNVTPANGGAQVTVTIDPPDAVTSEGEFRPTTLMQRVSEYVAANPGCSQRAIREGVKGRRAKYVDEALRILIAEAYIERPPGGQAHRHYSTRAYTADADTQPCPRVPTVSQPRPGHSEPNRVPVSRPLQGDTGPGHTPSIADRVHALSHLPEVEAQARWEALAAEQHQNGNGQTPLDAQTAAYLQSLEPEPEAA
jgi:hypothetical protein